MAEEKSVGVWVGIAASVVAVLAFFGITNFDQLRKAVDPASATAAACEKATEAQQARVYQDNFAAKYRTYSLQLGVAADSTDDAELKAYLRSSADAAEELANAADSEEGYSSAMYGKSVSSDTNWVKYCIKQRA